MYVAQDGIAAWQKGEQPWPNPGSQVPAGGGGGGQRAEQHSVLAAPHVRRRLDDGLLKRLGGSGAGVGVEGAVGPAGWGWEAGGQGR